MAVTESRREEAESQILKLQYERNSILQQLNSKGELGNY